ncbi:MAG: hypothetical protein E6H09_06120 [Bacteroidetes bacterium]|jgi:hypothetical protein|nr:MAG: hypothetical protein E6H09_06120 [Bacteroidota bacterium]
MDKMISLEFTYRSKTYYALIRTKINEKKISYVVTVMNGELERLLYGHHKIVDENGVLLSDRDISDGRVMELKECITRALCEHLETSALMN